MSIFKRLSTTFVARLDQIVGDIENHDSVVEATVKELQKKVAEANIRSERVTREANQLQAQITQRQSDSERWRKRAIECAKEDEHKALECVSRARHCDQQAEQLKQTLQQYQHAASKLARDIATAEQRSREVKQKHSLMRARQSTASAIEASHNAGDESITMLSDTFDRWELKLRQAEMSLETYPNIDHLEQEFVQQEENSELRQELDALLAQNEGTEK